MEVHKLLTDIGHLFNPAVTAQIAEHIRNMIPGLGDASGPHVIDCDAPPLAPSDLDDWRVAEHAEHGPFTWNPLRIRLHRTQEQRADPSTLGSAVQAGLEGKRVANATMLDYLLDNQHIVPETWHNGRNVSIFFWGTLYSNKNGFTCVRCMRWTDDRWIGDLGWLDLPWRRDYYAALLTA